MRAFEFYFNTKEHPDLAFELFSYEPTDPEQKKRGSLYIAGELENLLPSNAALLQTLAETIRETYYSGSLGNQKKPAKIIETSLKKALKKANEFLQEESRKGNVHWLGNLHMAILALGETGEEPYPLYFTKHGDMHLWIARNGQLTNISKNLDSHQAQEPGNTFGNIAGGSILLDDRIAVLTNALEKALEQENVLNDFAYLSEEKQLKNLFRSREEKLSKISGALLFLLVKVATRKSLATAKPKLPQLLLGTGTAVKSKALLRSVSPLIQAAKQTTIQRQLPFSKLSSVVPKSLPRHPANLLNLRSVNSLFSLPSKRALSGDRLLIVFMMVLIGAGIALVAFKTELRPGSDTSELTVERVGSLLKEAEQALVLGEKERATSLLQDAMLLIRFYSELHNDKLPEHIAELEQQANVQLQELYGVTIVESPAITVNFNNVFGGVSPSSFHLEGSLLYGYAKDKNTLAVADVRTGTVESQSHSAAFGAGMPYGDSSLLFATDNTVHRFRNGVEQGNVALAVPQHVVLADVESYGTNVYLLDSATGNILSYANVLSGSVASLSDWIKSGQEKAAQPAALAIDGNIWVASHSGIVYQYFRGKLQQTIMISDLYPPISKISDIATNRSSQYLYLLDSVGYRVIALDKSGNVQKQYQSPRFAGASSIALNEAGTRLYLLSGDTVYEISL